MDSTAPSNVQQVKSLPPPPWDTLLESLFLHGGGGLLLRREAGKQLLPAGDDIQGDGLQRSRGGLSLGHTG